MKRTGLFSCSILIFLLSQAMLLPSTQAAIVTSGYVVPSNPASWTLSTMSAVGEGGNTGSMTVNAGSDIYTNFGYIGLEGGTGVVTIMGSGSTWTSSTYIYAGIHGGNGTLNILEGAVVSSMFNQISYDNSVGKAVIDGAGSALISTCDLSVGSRGGYGSLKIAHAGRASSYSGIIGAFSGTVGLATVTGSGSKWDTSNLYVGGDGGTGTINITDGAAVTMDTAIIGPQSLLAIDVGRGSSVKVNGTISNNGTIRLLAGAGVLANTPNYSPISAITWDSGIYQAVGGTWDANHVFTPSSVQSGNSGAPITIDLQSQQRLLVSDAVTGWQLGGSFAASSVSNNLTVTASAISDGPLTSLNNLLPSGQAVLGGWDLSAGGNSAGDLAYLSFKIGSGYSADDLQVWSLSGSTWSKLDAADLNYDGAYANFTVSGLKTYALSAVSVPEPSAIVMLLSLSLGSLLWWRRNSSKLRS